MINVITEEQEIHDNIIADFIDISDVGDIYDALLNNCPSLLRDHFTNDEAMFDTVKTAVMQSSGFRSEMQYELEQAVEREESLA